MTALPKRPRWAIGLVLALSLLPLVACTRPRPEPTSALPSELQSEPAIRASAPKAGDTVRSPIPVSGRARLEAGQMLVGQVLGPEGDGLRWRGNAALDVGAQGRFEGEIAYTLGAGGAGFVELLVIDAAGGTVITRQRIPVVLAAAP